jgi:hypothetical protein
MSDPFYAEYLLVPTIDILYLMGEYCSLFPKDDVAGTGPKGAL